MENIWKTKSEKWERMEEGSAGMVCTANGRYLITFGGFVYEESDDYFSFDYLGDDKKETDSIIVYDLEKREAKPMVTQIRCPIKAGFHGAMMSDKQFDELLTFGFIRKCFKSRHMRVGVLTATLSL